MLRRRIKAFTTLLELLAQAIVKGGPEVTSLAKRSIHASTALSRAAGVALAGNESLRESLPTHGRIATVSLVKTKAKPSHP